MITPHIPPEDLIDYVRGELPPPLDAFAHAHLLACATCRAEFERETLFTEQLRAAAEAETFALPDSVKADVRKAVSGIRIFRFTQLSSPVRAALLLPAAAMLIGVLFLHPFPLARIAHPTIAAAFYLDAHAAQQATNPLTEHNAAPYNETAYGETARDVVR